ncbi:hypothetical protein PR048_017212 [Dryococelus australis]|uniref:Transmembrane protein n=1 Tax=Dryococelus australis TaxID=614101 RepID=A0ABQ9H8W3_9NEOP|nr:hypothetical protein PR048_017212 [Dryococelus australis]
MGRFRQVGSRRGGRCPSWRGPAHRGAQTRAAVVPRAGKLTRRLLCYHSDHCMSHSSPPRPSALPGAETQATSTPPPTERQPHPSTLTLAELPEPPIPVSEIGPIPPPPMFSSPSPTMLLRQGQPTPQGLHNAVPLDLSDYMYEEQDDLDGECEGDEDHFSFRVPQPDPSIDTSRVEEIPAKEPKFHAVPLKSALKKKAGGSAGCTPQGTPTQESRPLAIRQEHAVSVNVFDMSSSRPVRFGIALPSCTMENKENTRPYIIREDVDGDSSDGPVLYRDDGDDDDDDDEESTYGTGTVLDLLHVLFCLHALCLFATCFLACFALLWPLLCSLRKRHRHTQDCAL